MKVNLGTTALEIALKVTGGAVDDTPANPELNSFGSLMEAKHALNSALGTTKTRSKRKPRPRDRRREKAARKANRR